MLELMNEASADMSSMFFQTRTPSIFLMYPLWISRAVAK
jgi:hypothetical protein